MQSRAEACAVVALLRLGTRGWSECAELVEAAGSALAVLDQELEQIGAALTLFGDDCR